MAHVQPSRQALLTRLQEMSDRNAEEFLPDLPGCLVLWFYACSVLGTAHFVGIACMHAVCTTKVTARDASST